MPPRPTLGPRRLSVIALAAALAAPLLGVLSPSTPADALAVPHPVPEVVAGFVATPIAALPVPTALAFGPGDGDGPDLYATALDGAVWRVGLVWTPAGPVATGAARVVTGFSQPLGIIFDGASMYVADSHGGTESGRTDGRITKVDGTTKTVVVDGLPNGRHNTNHLRFGPDGRLYIANGNPNDNGVAGGDADVFPLSGAFLSVELAQLAADGPAILHWRDASGTPIPPGQVATHPRNADFSSKVSVLAWGFRNVFGIAFAPAPLAYAGVAYSGMNGADEPPSQDALFRIAPGQDHGFPFCYNVGVAAATGAGVSVTANPTFPAADCSTKPAATALLGWHTCATGLDLPVDAAAGMPDWSFPSAMRSSVFVGECGPLFPEDWIAKMASDPARATHSLGHKVVRVELDPVTGEAVAVHDFMDAVPAALDVLFGPDGAMYVAHGAGVVRVGALPLP